MVLCFADLQAEISEIQHMRIDTDLKHFPVTFSAHHSWLKNSASLTTFKRYIFNN